MIVLSKKVLVKLEKIKKRAEKKTKLIRDMQNIPIYCGDEIYADLQKQYTELEKGRKE
jgi:hypothetical protein